MRIRDKALRALMEEARAQGWEIVPTRNGHLKWTHPDASGIVITATTTSDWRSIKNTRAQMRRYMRGAEK